MTSGEQYVITTGMTQMQLWSADSWDWTLTVSTLDLIQLISYYVLYVIMYVIYNVLCLCSSLF